MRRGRSRLAIVLGAALAASAAGTEPITPEQFEKLHALIKPQPGEWRFAQVEWMPSVWEARKKAAEEGKPILIWFMAGEPLGQC